MHDQGFEILSVAEESNGREAALPFIEPVNPGYPVLFDPAHVIAELYGTRNVPAGIWIDEQGRIVRPAEQASARRRPGPGEEPVPHEKYLSALRDWVRQSSESIYVLPEGDVAQRANRPTAEEAEAVASFRLGVYLHEQGHDADAIPHFKRAHALQPTNWNYKRQAWNLGDSQRDYGTSYQEEIKKYGPFYAPLDLPDLPGTTATPSSTS